MTLWTFLGLAVLILWFWLCPILVAARVGQLLKRKGKEKVKEWQAKGSTKEVTTS